jgi:L-fucose isomerase-like protein
MRSSRRNGGKVERNSLSTSKVLRLRLPRHKTSDAQKICAGMGEIMKKVKLGVVITRRDTFPSPDKAGENYIRIRKRLQEIFSQMPAVTCIEADSLFADGMLVELADVEKAEDYFISKHIDALFVAHANFGQEEVIGMLCHKLQVPVLIWGPRDGSPEEGLPFRDTDTQCGLFASTRVLQRYGLPFTYIENCWLEAPLLVQEIDRFIRAASVVKTFRNLRVLQLSTRPRQFLSVKINEGELLERFGIHVVPVESSEVLSTIDEVLVKDRQELYKLITDWRESVDLSAMETADIEKMAALVLGIRKMALQYDCNTVASECWRMFITKYKISPCFAFGYLSQTGLPVCCENDIHGAISSVLAQAAALYETPSFLADITVRHPYNDNAELLWHCGPFPPVLAKDKAKAAGGKGEYELKDGELTLVRFDADHGKYYLFADEVTTVSGPKTTGNYVWVETENWPAWEKKLMYGPYIHHIAGVYGKYKSVMAEACRYLKLIHDYVDVR